MTETMRIGFRVDAGDTIGTGHVMEVISLITQLREDINFEPVVLTSNNDFAVSKFREAEINTIHNISSGVPEETELEEIITILSQYSVSHLVIDLINRSEAYYGYLYKKLTSTCIILDNNEYKELPASVVVNFSVTQDPTWYKTATTYGTRYLIGPQYFFWDKAIRGTQKRNLHPEVEAVLVNQGGSDPFGLTVKILRAVEQENLPQKFLFVLGGHVQKGHRIELEKTSRHLKSNSVFFDNLPRETLYSLMEAADMAISAAGNTLYELLYIGVPTLVISHHQAHDEVAKAFERRGAVMNLGVGHELGEREIAAAIQKLATNYPLRQRLQHNGQKLFDNRYGSTLTAELVRLYT